MRRPKLKVKYLKVPLTKNMDKALNYLSKVTHMSRANTAKIILGRGISLKLTSVNKELDYEKVMDNFADMNKEFLDLHEGKL